MTRKKKAAASPALTRRELDIMSVLWERGEASATEVRDQVGENLAYTTVSTILRILERKGVVAYRPGPGKSHIYYPLLDREAAGGSVLDRLLARVYDHSPVRLLTHLVSREAVSKDDIRQMRELLAAAEKRKKGK
jgi:BlaI family transcriptional regulator, penicillinase repressor